MAVVFDAVGPSATGTSVSGAPPSGLTWSHTCTGTNRLLVVGVAYAAGGAYGGNDSTASMSATYNGVSMTSAGIRHSNDATVGFAQLFYLVAPATGSNTVSVSISGWGGNTVEVLGGSVSFTGVSQSTPIQNFTTAAGSSSSPSLSVATSSQNMAVALSASGTNITSDSQTSRWLLNHDGNTGVGNITQSTANNASSATFSYTLASSDFWAVLGLDVVASSSGALTPLPWLRF